VIKVLNSKTMGITLVGLVLFSVGGYYFLSISSVDAVSIQLSEFSTTESELVSTFTVDVKINIEYEGKLSCILSEREMTLYINGINCGTKEFTESWEKMEPDSYNDYTTSFVVFDEYNSILLAEADTYEIFIRLKAKAEAGWVEKRIEVTCEEFHGSGTISEDTENSGTSDMDNSPGEAYYIYGEATTQNAEIWVKFWFMDENEVYTRSDDGIMELSITDEVGTLLFTDTFNVKNDDYEILYDLGEECYVYSCRIPLKDILDGVGRGTIDLKFSTSDVYWTQEYPVDVPQIDVSEFLVISEDYGYDGDIGTSVFGKITNVGDVNIEDVEYKIEYFDENNNLRAVDDGWFTYSTWGSIGIIEPGDDHYFEIWTSDHFGDNFTYNITLSGEATTETPYKNMEILSPSVSEDKGVVTITGYVKNLGEPRNSIEVTVVLFDNNGKILTVESRLFGEVVSEMTLPFEFICYNMFMAGDYDSYLLYINSFY